MKTWLLSAAIIPLSFGIFSDAYALESPHQIGYFCDPDMVTITDGQYYVPPSTTCIYQSPSISGFKVGSIYQGVIGSSTSKTGHALGQNPQATDSDRFVFNGAQQGDDFFIEIHKDRGPDSGDNAAFRAYFSQGTGVPPHEDFGFLRFKYGVPPEVPKEPDPVIVIPGILGSQERNGEWVIDPILHTYDDLIATLDTNGFTPDADLFAFPYDWRKSNVETAMLLKQKIDAVKTICECEKVDLVAHSMGGLVARQYIQSDAYEQDVDQLIFLGTPHLGAPKAYLMWEGGEMGPLFPLENFIIEEFLSQEAYENGYENMFTYIREAPIVSVQELLPVYSYIFNADLKEYPSGYPENPFLENLNANSDALSSSGVEVHNIIGSTVEQNTITGIRVEAEHGYSPLWPHGYPEDYYSLTGDNGLEKGSGDETVPLPSAAFINSNIVEKSYPHNSLPLEAEGDVYQILTEKIAGILSRQYGSGIKKLLHIKILSPADLLVIDPAGRKVGKESNASINDIPGAFYSGFDTETEFITIPNPIDGEYSVIVQGMGSGEYTVETSYVSEESFAEKQHTGITVLGRITELALRLDTDHPDNLELETPDADAPSITIKAPLSKDYLRSESLPIEVSAEDASGMPILETKLGTTTIPNKGTVDLFFQKLGTSTITASSTDIFGNSTTSSRTFRIIATASSTIADFERAYALSWMTKKTYDGLRQKIKGILVIRKVIKNIVQTIVETGPNGKKTSKKVQKKIETSEQVIDKVAAKAILKELDKYRGKGLDERAYQLLREDVTWIINN